MIYDFIQKYKNLLGNESNDFFDALNIIRPKSFRLNSPRKTDYTEEIKTLTKIEKDKNFNNVFTLKDNNFSLIKTISFLTGGIYIQNPSSLFPVKILSELMPEYPIILDVSAAPGGKTTALSEILNRRGLIIANEISTSRLKDLHFNLEKYTAWNVKTTNLDGRKLNKFFKNTFDGVLLDAPCSNENKIMKNKEVASFWSNEFIQRMQKLQKELILSAFDTLKPGGILVYSTCTFSIEENEQVIEYLLIEKDDAELVDINFDKYPKGLSCNDEINEKIIRIFPHQIPYDGFFVSAIKKKGELKTNSFKISQNIKYLQSYFINNEMPFIIKNIKNLAFAETDINLPNIPFKKTGIKAGKIIKNNLEISTQMLWEFSYLLKKELKIKINYEEAIEFLKGKDLQKYFNSKGIYGVFFDNIPVGTVKPVDKILKNKLDRYFLYGRNF
jgi:16S rRNA (cytosine1407-C5)-methyltransferase